MSSLVLVSHIYESMWPNTSGWAKGPSLWKCREPRTKHACDTWTCLCQESSSHWLILVARIKRVILKTVLLITEGSTLSYIWVKKRELQSWEISQISHPLQKSLPWYVNLVSLCLNISTGRKLVLFFLKHCIPIILNTVGAS